MGDVGNDHFHDVIQKWGGGLASLGDIADEAIELGSSLALGGHHAG